MRISVFKVYLFQIAIQQWHPKQKKTFKSKKIHPDPPRPSHHLPPPFRGAHCLNCITFVLLPQIEDSPENRKLLSELLDCMGVECCFSFASTPSLTQPVCLRTVAGYDVNQFRLK